MHTPAAPRFDLYRPIHKALRRFMTDTLERIGALDIFDDARMATELEQLDALLDGCRTHLKHENDFLHTAIEARQPGGAQRTADDHVDHLESIDALAAEAAALRAAPREQRDARAALLYRHLALFVAENFQHMHVEETVNNAALWAHYSDDELLGLHERLVASVPPAEMMGWLRWMARALAPAEMAAVLGGMRAKAPAEVFEGVVQMVRGECSARWPAIARELGAAQPA